MENESDVRVMHEYENREGGGVVSASQVEMAPGEESPKTTNGSPTKGKSKRIILQKTLQQKGIESIEDFDDFIRTTERDGSVIADLCDMLDANVFQITQRVAAIKKDTKRPARIEAKQEPDPGNDWDILRSALESAFAGLGGTRSEGNDSRHWPEHVQLLGAMYKVEPRQAYEKVKELAISIEVSKTMYGTADIRQGSRSRQFWKERMREYEEDGITEGAVLPTKDGVTDGVFRISNQQIKIPVHNEREQPLFLQKGEELGELGSEKWHEKWEECAMLDHEELVMCIDEKRELLREQIERSREHEKMDPDLQFRRT
ncbi:hypothetical protein ANCCEY_11772 [Ancylostoma ceylanicum]|uniref:Uncharacterized protein n=1 Tax=Ancylostoma ceylanicum TaxID=53326 RepID=A0A0D6LNC2_9BILA|nr:hypothetical protein ANCCEY_11772 [Ancylostoma ceylanicum]